MFINDLFSEGKPAMQDKSLWKETIVGNMVCFVFQKREKNLRFFDVTYSPPIPV
jgi:hypothetical protein